MGDQDQHLSLKCRDYQCDVSLKHCVCFDGTYLKHSWNFVREKSPSFSLWAFIVLVRASGDVWSSTQPSKVRSQLRLSRRIFQKQYLAYKWLGVKFTVTMM